MSQYIADSIGIVKEVLQENHPNSSVKSADSGQSDFRVSAVGASVTANAYGEHEFSDEDVDEILERAENELEGRDLIHKKSTSEKLWFDLKK